MRKGQTITQCGEVSTSGAKSRILHIACASAFAIAVSTGSAAMAQQSVAAGETRTLTEGEVIEYNGSANLNALSIGAGATVTGNGAIITTTGSHTNFSSPSVGLYAATGSRVDLTGGSVSATGSAFTRGIQGLEATISTNGTDVTTTGDNSHAIQGHTSANLTINGGTISTGGSDSFGLYSQKGSLLTANDVEVVTGGTNGFGLFSYDADARIVFNGGSVTTSGATGHGVVAGLDTRIDLDGSAIATNGASAVGLIADQANTLITANDVEVSTSGIWSHGVHAKSVDAAGPARIELVGGSVTTLNETGRGTQDGDGSRSYALFAEGEGASISAEGVNVRTLGQRAYGAHALGGSQIDLTDVDVETDGFMAYGLYASGPGSVITGTNVNVTTSGQVGDAVWAYNGGRVVLDGGSLQALGEMNPNAPGETVIGLLATGGINGVNNGVIDARNVMVEVAAENGIGVRAGSPIGSDNTSGTIVLADSTVTVTGLGADAARVAYGSELTATNTALTSEQGVGIRLIDNATVTLNGATIAAAEESFVSTFNTAGSIQTITVGAGSDVSENNGTLLLVDRGENGGDGVVNVTLAAGSISAGDFIDLGTKTSGGTDVIVEAGAEWTGLVRGIRNFQTTESSGAQIDFTDGSSIGGDLSLDAADVTFGDNVQISGDVAFTGTSSIVGGINTPILVRGNVFSGNEVSFGGNWNIAGNLSSYGFITPGNSIGQIAVGGDLTLGSDSVYLVEINAAGEADRIDVAGTATLGGSVTVTPLDGFLIGSPYTILTAGDLGETEFDDVSFDADFAFIDAVLSYDENNVFVTIERNGVSYESIAVTPNEVEAAGALDRLEISSPLAQALALTTTEAATGAFGQVSGEVHASTRSALIEDSRHIRNGMNDRLSTSLGQDGLAFWAAGFGSWGEHNGNTNVAEMTRDTRGGMIGLDAGLGSQGRIGIVGGYSTSDFDSLRGNVDVKSSHVGLYAGTRMGGFGLRVGAAYTWHDVETSRTVSFAGISNALTTNYDANTTQVFGDISFPVSLGGGTVEPFANVAWVQLDTKGFSEAGGVTGLTGTEQKSDVTFSTVGLRATTADLFKSGIAAHASAGWRHAFNDRLPTVDMAFVGGSAFSVAGTPISKDAAVLDLGLNAALSSNAVIGVSYSGQIGDRGIDNSVKAGLSFRF